MISADSRDYTPDPPAYLDPRWVLSMQRRLKAYRDTGRMDWYEEAIKGYDAFLDSMADDDHPELMEFREVADWLRGNRCDLN